MTTDNTTESSVISRRTILRTTANAAWLVPAITVANAVPAMAACSVNQAKNFSVTLGNKVNTGTALNPKYTQDVTVKTLGGTAGAPFASVTLRLTHVSDTLNIKSYNVTAGSGWHAIGSQGNNKPYYEFTRNFTACQADAVSTFTFTYGALGALTGSPSFTATLTY